MPCGPRNFSSPLGSKQLLPSITLPRSPTIATFFARYTRKIALFQWFVIFAASGSRMFSSEPSNGSTASPTIMPS